MSHAAAPPERWAAEAFATLPSQTLPTPGTATPMLLPAHGIYTRRIGWSDAGNHARTSEPKLVERVLIGPLRSLSSLPSIP